MQCVRCLRDTARKVADAPDGSGAWEVYACTDCNYTWRSSEPEEITVIAKRDPWGQLDKRDWSTFRRSNYVAGRSKPE